MQQLEDFWADFAEWWDTIDWGDAPGWTGAILTSASLFLALSIVARDKKMARRAEVKRVVIRHRVLTTFDSATLQVTIYNANPHPLPLVTLSHQGELVWHAKVFKGPSGDPAIPPGEEGIVSIPYERPLKDRFFFLHVTDSQGAEWYRGLVSQKVLRAWRVKWWLHRDRRALCREKVRMWGTKAQRCWAKLTGKRDRAQ